jgi:predicted DNA-binding protein (UPF0251 family)
MIQLKLTKDKFIAIINVVTVITQALDKQLAGMKRDMKFARVRSDISVLQELSRKMRSKYVMMEDKEGNHRVTLSVNEIQAFVIMYYRDIDKQEAYNSAVLHEISDTIFQNLLT